MVGLDQYPDGVPAVLLSHLARRGPDAGLEAEGLHPGPATHVPFGHRPASGRFERCEQMLGPDVLAVDVVEVAVPGLRHDRQGPDANLAPACDAGGHQRVAHHPDAVRVGEADRGRQHPRFADPFEPGHLAVAVEGVAPREDRLFPGIAIVRDHDGDAGPDRSLADLQRPISRDERRVADANARDVGDGVQRAGRERADDDAKVTRPHRHGPFRRLRTRGGRGSPPPRLLPQPVGP